MWEILKKELRDFLFNPRYLISFSVVAALILLSVYTGYSAYQSEIQNADAAEALSMQEARENHTYQFISLDLNRRPSLLSIFDFGLNSVIAREGHVETNDSQPAQVRNSRSEESPVFALFRELDLTQTVSYVVTLLSILFAHSLVSGEKERGTLKLLSTYPISRSSIITAKFLGAFIPLALLLFIPLMISVLGLMFFAGINFTASQWVSLGLIFIANLLCILVFFSMALAASCLTRSSFMSLLVCLVFWVLSVAVIPKAAAQLAQNISPSMSVFEKQQRLENLREEMKIRGAIRTADAINAAKLDMAGWRKNYQDLQNRCKKQTNLEELSAARDIFSEYARKRNKLQHTIENYTRISPVSSFQYILHSLTESGQQQLDTFEKDLNRYVKELDNYSEKQYLANKSAEKGKSKSGFNVRMENDENGYLKITSTRGFDQSKVDLSTMPVFKPSEQNWTINLFRILPDFAILAVYTILFLLISFLAFLRYDVR